MTPDASIVLELMNVIAARKASPDGERSYVRSLLAGGVARIGGKIVEEAAEVVEAADEPGPAGRAHLIHEVADLLFHTLVLLGHNDIPWGDVEAELARRFGVGGHAEKAARPPRSAGEGEVPPVNPASPSSSDAGGRG